MNLTLLLLATLAPQAAPTTGPRAETTKPLPSPPAMADVKTTWVAPVKPPLTPEELASQASDPSSDQAAADAPRNELPAALAGARYRIDRDRLFYDRPGDGRLWVRGRSYKASFGPEGATYVPDFGPDAPRNFPISLSVARVTVGGEELAFTAAADAQREGDVVRFDRGSFVERYDMALESMEQKFVFTSLPATGELAVEVDIESELALTQGADGALVFENEFGRVGYTSALIVDAHGSRIPIGTTRAAGRVELRAPQSVLAQCAFPITIDPVIHTMSFATGDDLTYNIDTAYDASYNRFLVVWEDVFSSTDHDIWSECWTPSGLQIIQSGAWVDFTTDNWANPHVANNNIANTFLVVAQRGSNGNRRITGRLRYASSAFQEAQFVVDAGGIGERYNPDVGGDPLLIGPTYFCVVFEREFNAGSDHDIHAQLVSSTGARAGGTIYLDNTSATLDRFPRISRSNGAGPFSSQRWNLVWNRQFTTTDEDVRGAQLDWAGNIVTPSFSVDYSGYDDEYPAVSSPLDDPGDGQRPYLAVYERSNLSDGVVYGAVLQGGTRLSNPNLSALENVTNRTRLLPAVDSDGRTFMMASSRRFSTSTSDYDVYISNFAFDGVNLQPLETSNLAASVSFEYDVQVASTYSGGGARRRCMAVWTDFDGSSDFDVEGGVYEGPVPPLGFPYCVAISNSTGQGGQISGIGSPSVSDQNMALRVTGLPANTPGLFFFGTSPLDVPFGDGKRCVGGQVRRMYSFVHSSPAGIATRTIDWSSGYASSITAGNVYWQLWYRDGAAGLTGFNLSNGLHTVLYP